MKTTTQQHGVRYEFDNGYVLSVLDDWAAMGKPECPYEFMAWGNGKETEAVGYQTKEDIDKIISMFEENNTELIDKFFDDYCHDKLFYIVPRIPVVAIQTGHVGTAFNNDEDYYYWKVEYIELSEGDIVEKLTLTGESYREVDYRYDEFLSDEENERRWREARDREYREHIQAIKDNASRKGYEVIRIHMM